MSNQIDTYYMDIDTQERVPVTYRVHLAMPAEYTGHIDIEATSQEEASRIAMEERHPYWDAEWDDFDDPGDKHAIEVTDVECEEPPTNAMLIRPTDSKARLDELFDFHGMYEIRVERKITFTNTLMIEADSLELATIEAQRMMKDAFQQDTGDRVEEYRVISVS